MTINVRKAAQVAAFFVTARGGKTDLIDLIKLIYLADRRFLDRHGFPILFDDFYNMEFGPVDSATYDHAKGEGSDNKTWQSYIARNGNTMSLSNKKAAENLDQLSDAELAVLNEVFTECAKIKNFNLVDWIHENCKEWENPGKSSQYLPYEKVFQVLKKKNPEELAERVYLMRSLQEETAKSQ